MRQPKADYIKYTYGDYMVMRTTAGAYQVYLRTSHDDKTQTYTRQPDYKKTGKIIIFKSLKSAKDYIKGII